MHFPKERDPSWWVAVGQRVREFREALGLTQDEVAALTNGAMDRIRVLKLEDGTYKLQADGPRLGLASAFGLSLDDLYDLMTGGLTIEAALRRSKVVPKVAS